MYVPLELMERDLPDHGVDLVLDLLGQQRLLLARIFRLVEQRLEGQHFAEDGGGLGQR